MVILKWLHSMLIGSRPEVEQAGAGRAAEEFGKSDKKSKGISSVDIINATLVDRAEDFDDLIASGSPLLKRKRLKRKVRRKVEMAMAEELSDPKIIDEITERITDVTEIDPYYQKLFCKDAEE